jgi:hypothetical protein
VQEAAEDVFRHHVGGDPGSVRHGHAVGVPCAEMVDADATIGDPAGPFLGEDAFARVGTGSNRTV